MMDEYVSKEAVNRELQRFIGYLDEDMIYRLKIAINRLPAADVKPVVRGEWISVPHKRARICSHCECDEPYKFAENDADVYNLCPNCGADMRSSHGR